MRYGYPKNLIYDIFKNDFSREVMEIKQELFKKKVNEIIHNEFIFDDYELSIFWNMYPDEKNLVDIAKKWNTTKQNISRVKKYIINKFNNIFYKMYFLDNETSDLTTFEEKFKAFLKETKQDILINDLPLSYGSKNRLMSNNILTLNDLLNLVEQYGVKKIKVLRTIGALRYQEIIDFLKRFELIEESVIDNDNETI